MIDKNLVERFPVFYALVLIMSILMVFKLGSEFHRLVLEEGPLGAIDLKQRYADVHHWFSGNDIYNHKGVSGTYPPASYVILWPFLGWLSFTAARWFWAASTLIALIGTVQLIDKQSNANKALERYLAALMLLSMNATGVTIGNGQLVLHILPLLLAGLLQLKRENPTWGMDIGVAVLYLASLVKPNITVPFFWIVVFVPGRLRPAVLITIGYIALTLFATTFQESGLLTTLTKWIDHSSKICFDSGYADLHLLLSTLHISQYNLPASFVLFAGLGIWIRRNRKVDIWLLLGVTGVISRFWTYHGLYDDVLLILPMVALFRILKKRHMENIERTAAILLASLILVMLAPARMHFFWQAPWPFLFATAHVIVGFAVFVFLVSVAWIEKTKKHRDGVPA